MPVTHLFSLILASEFRGEMAPGFFQSPEVFIGLKARDAWLAVGNGV